MSTVDQATAGRFIRFADGSEKPLPDCTTQELIATGNAHWCIDEELLVYVYVRAASSASLDDPAVRTVLAELAHRYGHSIFGDLALLLFDDGPELSLREPRSSPTG